MQACDSTRVKVRGHPQGSGLAFYLVNHYQISSHHSWEDAGLQSHRHPAAAFKSTRKIHTEHRVCLTHTVDH